jgi:glycosyltransferase involved in cell wall biosynthesis
MRKLLIVAYYFPPLGGAGVQRTLKFIKYLPEFGWQPVVLTVRRSSYKLKDTSLEHEIPSHISVYRTPALLLPSWLPWRLRNFIGKDLMLVDRQIGWLPFAVRHTRGIIQKEDNIRAIYTTSAPYTAHLIGLRLKRITSLPWLADFRDPWVGNFSISFLTRWHEQLARRMESQVVQTADRITVVSEPMRQAFLSRYTGLEDKRVLTLPNGYDPDDFLNAEPLEREEKDCMHITYTGSFYGRRQTSYYFLQGLQAAINSNCVSRHKVRVWFVGNMNQDVLRQIEAFNLEDVVRMVGYLSHPQSISYLLGADLLLLIIGPGPGSEVVFTGKIFEYLASHRPILALVPPGVAADLLEESHAGIIVDPHDVKAITEQIVNLYGKWENDDLNVASDQSVINRYDRRRLTGKLADALDAIGKMEEDL